jgi:hypothetical protein
VQSQLLKTMTELKYSSADAASKVDAIAEAMRIFSLASHRAQLEAAVENILESQEGRLLEAGVRKELLGSLRKIPCEEVEKNRSGYEEYLEFLRKTL